MKLKIAALLLCLACPLQATENEDNFSLDLLELGRTAGACGVMGELLEFQDTSKLDNGYRFLNRFFKFQAERKGKTPKEFTSECVTITKTYVFFFNRLQKGF